MGLEVEVEVGLRGVEDGVWGDEKDDLEGITRGSGVQVMAGERGGGGARKKEEGWRMDPLKQNVPCVVIQLQDPIHRIPAAHRDGQRRKPC